MPLVDITPSHGGLAFATGSHVDGPLSDIEISDASEEHFEVMTVIWFADGLSVLEPANLAQAGDLASWLPGLAPGDLAASRANPAISAAPSGSPGSASAGSGRRPAPPGP